MYSNGKDRGTFNFWVHSFLDSGGVCGYHHDRVTPQEDDDPMQVHFVGSKIEYATISLPHFLNQILDATDPVAIALETLLYAAPGDSWNDAVEWLQENLWEALDLTLEHQDNFRGLEVDDDIMKALDAIDAWLEDEPVFGAGFYTYNSKNSLDQDFAVSLLIGNEEFYGEQYAIVRTHNGCDARGGFSEPVVALVRDIEYFYSWEANLYCPECHASWESEHQYIQDMEQIGWPTLDDVDQWAALLETTQQYAAGQLSFMKEEPKWIHTISMDTAADVIAALDEGAELADAFPQALVNGVAPTGRFSEADAGDTLLLCPNCLRFSAYVSSTVAYGF